MKGIIRRRRWTFDTVLLFKKACLISKLERFAVVGRFNVIVLRENIPKNPTLELRVTTHTSSRHDHGINALKLQINSSTQFQSIPNTSCFWHVSPSEIVLISVYEALLKMQRSFWNENPCWEMFPLCCWLKESEANWCCDSPSDLRYASPENRQ